MNPPPNRRIYPESASTGLDRGSAAGPGGSPVTRTIFISEDRTAATNVKQKLASSVPSRLRRDDVAVEDWAIIGDRRHARDRLDEYRERLSVTHLIGGGILPGVEENLLLQSHQWLAEMG